MEAAHQAAGGSDSPEAEEETWTVEAIVGWKTMEVFNDPDAEYDPTLSEYKWQMRYHIKWQGYSLRPNEFEPRSSFVDWPDLYDEQIEAILASDSSLRHPRDHEAEAEKLNAVLRKQKKRTDEEKKKKAEEKRKKTRRAKKASASRQSCSVSVVSQAPTPKGRSTQNSALPRFDANDLKDFPQSRAIRQLIPDTPPRRDAHGNLVSSPHEDIKPKVEVDEGFADDYEEKTGRAGGGEQAGARENQGSEGGECADESDEESGQQQQQQQPPFAGGGPVDDGFADDDELADEGGFADDDEVEIPAGAVASEVGGGVGAGLRRAIAVVPAPPVDEEMGFADDASDGGFADDDDEEGGVARAQLGKHSRPASDDDWADGASEEDVVAPPPAKVRRALPQAAPVRAAPTRRSTSAATSVRPLPAPAPRQLPPTRRASGRSDSGSLMDIDSDDEPLPQRPRKAAPLPSAKNLPSTTASKINSINIPRLPNRPPKPSPTPAQSTSRAAKAPVTVKQELVAKKKPTTMGARRPAPRIAPVSSEESADEAQASKRTTALSASTGSIGQRAARAVDPFNDGVAKTTVSNGFVRLNRPALEPQVGNFDIFKRNPRLNHLDRLTDKICALYDIPNILTNFFDLEATMKNGPNGPREAYIFAPGKEEKLSAKGRETLRDYTTLQYLLSGIDGVRQSDVLRPSVKAVFVHVSERDEIGAYPTGKLAELEHFRAREASDTVFVLFGERKKEKDFWGGGAEKEFVFKAFWTVNAALTISPNLFTQRPAQVSSLIDKAVPSRKDHLGRRDVRPWAPALFYADGGPFASPLPKDTAGLAKLIASIRCDGLVAFHHAVDQQKISLLDPFPKMPIQEDVYFPGKEDHHKYGSTGRQMLHEWLELLDDQSRKEALEANVDRLQLLSRQFRLTYLQLRRWIIVATDEEVKAAAAVPGVEVMTLEQAAKLVA